MAARKLATAGGAILAFQLQSLTVNAPLIIRFLLAWSRSLDRSTRIGAVVLGAVLLAGAALTSSELAAQTLPRGPLTTIDRLVVDKSERALYAMAKGRVIRQMAIGLGLVPEGHKQQEGDFRTPEGVYFIEAKNPDSDYFLSLKISYPNAADRAHARDLGVDPGGQIMIHGLPNEPRQLESSYLGTDWTDGCIAVSNSDMVDLWLMTPVNTPIEIRP